jgi:hypothetical protein
MSPERTLDSKCQVRDLLISYPKTTSDGVCEFADEIPCFC